MVELTPKDSSILTRITRYRTIPVKERVALLEEASPKAKEIGEIILGRSRREEADADTQAAADAYLKSFETKPRADAQRRLRKRLATAK